MPIQDKNIDKSLGNHDFAVTPIVLRNGGQVPISQTDLEIASMRMPFAGTIESIYAFVRALTAAATVDIQVDGTTVLTGNITPVAGVQTAGTLIAAPTFSEGSEIQFLVTTDGSGLMDDLIATISVRPNLQDE